MATISISRKHKLSHKKAKAVAERIARDLDKRYGLEYEWDGDHLDFERPGIAGRMRIAKDSIALDVSLGFLLIPLKTTFEREIGATLDQLLADA
ncbi:MAG: polyhydroxyalkanoic acid system family protein [Burkholderiales bacterium]|nr:polyhydroxyalkanoic acid system family protein [Burkholderiales bacterium]